MTAESIIQEVKEALNGRPGQPIVLGVCQALAKRLSQEVWIVRLATIIAGVFFTFPTLAIYILAGFFLSETEVRTRGFFSGLGVVIREFAEKLTNGLGRMCGSDTRPDYHGNSR